MRYFVDENGFISSAKPKLSATNKDKGKQKNKALQVAPPKPYVPPPPPPPRREMVYDPLMFDRRHPLFKAINDGNPGLVAGLLRKDPRLINIKGPTGESPLHHAAAKGRGSVVDVLVQFGGSFLAKDNKGRTPHLIAPPINTPPPPQPAPVQPVQPVQIEAVKMSAKGKQLRSLSSAKVTIQPKLPLANPPKRVLVACPYCRIMVREDRVQRHTQKVHDVTANSPIGTSAKYPSVKQKQTKRTLTSPSSLRLGHNQDRGSDTSSELTTNNNFESIHDRFTIRDGSRGWGHAWRDHGSYGSYPGFDAMDDDSDAG